MHETAYGMSISCWSSDVCSSDRQRLLVADEYTSDEGGRHPSNLREYTFDGQPTGRELPAGTFEAEAEGVALWSCTPDIGYWVAADQRYPQTHFLLFERERLDRTSIVDGKRVAVRVGLDGGRCNNKKTNTKNKK